MPNYDGRKPFEINCGHCGRVARHGDTRINSEKYRWNDWLTAFFQEKLGHDVTLRYRTKKCTFSMPQFPDRVPVCGKDFETVELTERHFSAIMEEVERLRTVETKSKEVEVENNRLKTELLQSKEKLHRISDFALQLAEEREISTTLEKITSDNNAASNNSKNVSVERGRLPKLPRRV